MRAQLVRAPGGPRADVDTGSPTFFLRRPLWCARRVGSRDWGLGLAKLALDPKPPRRVGRTAGGDAKKLVAGVAAATFFNPDPVP